MGKIKDISIMKKDLKNYQKIKGKSLIHRCCGEGMFQVENLLPENINEFYICSVNCGKAEIPYMAQILKYNPKSFIY